jgi:predicted Zn-dependent protease
MLKTNFTYFFDAQEIVYIAQYYIDFGKVNLAKKAIKIGYKQHPGNINILLLKSEILILENKLKKADQILDFINKIEPNNLDAFIQKATILSKLKKHDKSIEILNICLKYSEYKFEIWHLIAMEFLTTCNYKKAMIYFRLCIENEPNDHQVLYRQP